MPGILILERLARALRSQLSTAAVLTLSACLPPKSAGTLKADGVSAGGSSFRFGVAPHDAFDPASGAPTKVDIVGVGGWVTKDGASSFHADYVGKIIAVNKTALVYMYIAADTAKSQLGAEGDCDKNRDAPLCKKGAEVIRENIDSIVSKYEASADLISGAAKGKEVLLHIEPDWYQYSEDSQEHPFRRDESDDFRSRILYAIKNGCPSCQVIIDFSPWFNADGVTWSSVQQFYENADRSVVKYLGLVGKAFPFTTDKIDGKLTYAEMVQQTGLPLMVSSAFTFGGGATGLDDTWLTNDKVEQAKGFGIAGLMLSLDQPGRYDAFIEAYRSGAPQTAGNQPDAQPVQPAPQASQPAQPATQPPPSETYTTPAGTTRDCKTANYDAKTCQDINASEGQQSCIWNQTWKCVDGCAKWVREGCY